MRAWFAFSILCVGTTVSIAQEPWIYMKGSNTWILYRPRRLSGLHVMDLRIGQIRSSVQDAKLDEKPCKLYTWHSEIWPHAGGSDTQVDFDTKSWVGLDGKVMKIEARYQKWTTVYEATAVFNKDEIELTTRSSKEGKRTSTLIPAGGIELFDNAFKGILNKPDVKIEDRTSYYLLDPIKGAPVRYDVRVKNRVSGVFDKETVTGMSIEITGPAGPIIAYVNKEGVLVQVDYEKGVRVYPFSYTPTVKQINEPGFGGG